MEIQQRQIAYKISLTDLEKGSFIQAQGNNPNGIKLGNHLVSRVQVIAMVTSQSEGGFTIDDGSASMNVRVFEYNKEAPSPGDVVSLVGRPREFQAQRYILPEGFSVVDPDWMKIRKKELENINYDEIIKPINNNDVDDIISQNAPTSVVEDVKINEEEIVDESPMENPIEILLSKIKDFDTGSGSPHEDILRVCDEDMIQKLLESGEIFEIRPGMYKVLE